LFSHCGKSDAAIGGGGQDAGVSRDGETLNLHASAVAVAGRGLLIVGASGAGKSGLALRLMSRGARLVADDRVLVARHGASLVASAPAALRGLIEARGVGLLRAEPIEAAALALVVDLDAPAAARLPHPREIAYLGVQIELISGHGVPNLEASLVQLLKFGRAR
jgi:HPr kinase/phosphorylase